MTGTANQISPGTMYFPVHVQGTSKQSNENFLSCLDFL